MENKKLRLLVIIINYKTPQLVCDALESLDKQIEMGTDKVVIVDNASQDDSVTTINTFILSKGWDSWCNVIPSLQNGGFSAGNNIGIQSVDADYYLLLNSDAYIRDNAIKSLMLSAEADPSLGIIGPKLEWPDGSQQVSCFHNLSPANSFLHAAKTGVFAQFFKLFKIKEIVIPLEQHETERPDWLSFACVLLNGKMIKEIGLMDEGYFMYREDNDYCRRAINAGWRLKFESGSRVVHLNNGSSNQFGVKRLPKFYFNSRSRYFLKYYGRSGLLIANIFWSLGRIFSSLKELLFQKPKAFHSSMWKDIWIGTFSTWEQNEK
jgi:hypothetical protein